ncbi:MAG: molybdenum cofactor biosynthesis protein MoaE [Candidatus Eremiobacteraeota bacterium]|nr:molybdenum cofactor biosynthesis protein MoaE [Candidatus Eremiobacteraeota bacterium]MBV8435049.1 molybdenum cofactor biosynthesis protein MoaE [Candidatus Eremiobacteraeota bacterium]MBV8723475.1 molybdenum cofactor biosynthesis protein MoaE [Candidatus Eremiobacteraeota bacterium]
MHRIFDRPIDVPALEASVRAERCGGVVTFLGIVRDCADDGRPVTGLEYQAHAAMALAEFAAIEAEARHRFGDIEMAIAHRVGSLDVGEVAVAVAVAAPHRGEAFDACEYAIDELKRRAPIWKKELYAGGGGEWKANACRE